MKKGKYHIIYSWILLICFVAGQYMIYAHQHNSTGIVNAYKGSKKTSQQTVTEKCSLCDVMHHNAAVAKCQVYFNPERIIAHIYINPEYSFKSIQLILSSGRAPPAVNYNS